MNQKQKNAIDYVHPIIVDCMKHQEKPRQDKMKEVLAKGYDVDKEDVSFLISWANYAKAWVEDDESKTIDRCVERLKTIS